MAPLQTLALVAAAIYPAMSEYATGKMVTVMLSQNEYLGKFCAFILVDSISAEATALFHYTLEGRFIPPLVLPFIIRHSSIPVSAAQPGLAI